MIISRDRLLALAREEAEARAARRQLAAAYVVGSVAVGDPLCGGAADIDLILIHPATPLRRREIHRLSNDVHLDIYHRSRDEYDPPRELRTDPDLGTGLCGGVRLHDPDHFFDWVQAAACAQFDSPPNRFARAHTHLARARELRASLATADSWAQAFAQAAVDGANAVACLAGPPAGGRRLVDGLRTAFAQLERLDLFSSFLQLVGADAMDGWDLPSWLAGWAKSYDLAIGGDGDSTLAPVRRDYYLRAFQEMADQGHAEAVLVPLLLRWPQVLPPADHPAAGDIHTGWQKLLHSAGLDADRRRTRQSQLEGYLDSIERATLDWGEAHGA